jgi:tripartite-type tricarboxylate transporter receptor subunit TctC
VIKSFCEDINKVARVVAVKQLAKINKVLKTPEMAKRMESMNFEPPPIKTVDEFKAILAKDLKTWQSIAQDANILLD